MRKSFRRELLAGCFIHLAGDFDATQPIYILGDAAVKRFGDALPVFAGGQAVLVGRIADKRNLGKNRGQIPAILRSFPSARSSSPNPAVRRWTSPKPRSRAPQPQALPAKR